VPSAKAARLIGAVGSSEIISGSEVVLSRIVLVIVIGRGSGIDAVGARPAGTGVDTLVKSSLLLVGPNAAG
jgi:hypothetical protein